LRLRQFAKRRLEKGQFEKRRFETWLRLDFLKKNHFYLRMHFFHFVLSLKRLAQATQSTFETQLSESLLKFSEKKALTSNDKSCTSFQGCQIFLGTKYQNGKNITNYHELYQMSITVSIKYTVIFHCKTLRNLPKFGFLVWNQTIWQPCFFSLWNWKGRPWLPIVCFLFLMPRDRDSNWRSQMNYEIYIF
jgi:hypothetical protein